MNNRMDEFIPADEATVELREEQPNVPGEFGQYLEIAKEWAIRNPLPCLAAAFAAGVTLAWIIKRK
jgi:hypothetical protein